MKKILGLALILNLLIVSLVMAWTPAGGWDTWKQSMATYGFSASDTSKTTMTKGLLLPAGAYVDWGATYGSTGYGLRESSGKIQFKHSGGSWADLGSGGGSTFIGLTDTPAAYVGAANYFVKVNAGANALEFASGSVSSHAFLDSAVHTDTLTGSAVAGTFLIGNATPVWSASAYKLPTSIPSTGKVLVSNGTDIVGSTPTFPNASATVRKIIVSDGTNWVASTETYAAPGTANALLSSDGTNWTRLATSANITSFLGSADYATMRTNLGLVISTNVQAYDADLTTWAGLTPHANFQTMVPHTFSEMRTDLSLVPGTNIQAYDADLLAIANVSVAQGLILVGDSDPKWVGLAKGTQYYPLVAGASTVSYAQLTGAGIANDTITATQLNSVLTFADGDLIDLSGITHSAATDEGFVLPIWANVSPASDKPFIAWDAATSALKIYKGGWVTFSTTAAPIDAQYLVINSLDSTLTNERRFVDGAGILGTDAGAGSTYTLSFAPTELTNLTWGNGAGFTWTFDAGIGTDPTFVFGNQTIQITGTLTIASPFTLGSTSVTTTGTQLNYLNAATGSTGTNTTNLVFSASPTLTGTPISTTAAADTNTTQIATTAFVVGQAGASNPVIDGTAAPGTSLRYSRQDHVHPTDTGRQTADATLTALAGLTITSGSLIYGTGTDAFSILASSTQNKVLQMGATNPAWSAYTQPASVATGDVWYGSGTNAVSALSAGTQYKMLQMGATTPGWSAYTFPAAIAQGDLLYGSGTNAISALTKDANATRYLSNTGTTNNPAWAQVNLTNGVTGVLPDANVADDITLTNITQITNRAITNVTAGNWKTFYSNATGVITEVALGADGKLFRAGGTAAAPTFSTLTMPDTIALGSVFAANAANVLSAITSATGTYYLKNADGVVSWSAPAGTGDLKADGTIPLTANWNVGAYIITAAGFTAAKSSGVAGDIGLYEANSTDTDAAGFRGPASISANTSYRGQFPNARATTDNSVLAWGGTAVSGAGTPTDPYLHAMSFIVPLQVSGGTMTGKLITATPASTPAGINIPHGSEPSSLTNGDIWTTTSGLYARINGGTVGPYISAGSLIDDTAYNATSWDAVTGVGPSKNAVRDYFESLAPSGIVKPAAGGTGIANNAASTLTITGAYGTTITLTGATALDFSNLTTGDILLGNGTRSIARLALGTQYKVLQAGASTLAYSDVLYPASLTTNGMIYGASATGFGQTAAGTVQGQILTTGATPFVPVWSAYYLLGTSGQTYTFPTTSATLPANDQTFYIGTTQVAINRATNPLTLAGITLTAPVLGAATADSLLATGIVDGAAPVTITATSAGQTIGGTYKSGYWFTNPVEAAATFNFTLPTPAAAGLQYCVGNGAGKTGVLKVNAGTSNIIDLDGTNGSASGYAQATAVAGNFACFIGVDSTHWKAIPTKGTWSIAGP